MRIHPFFLTLLRRRAARTPLGAVVAGALTLFALRRRAKRRRLAEPAAQAPRTFADVVDQGWEVQPHPV